jgi:putative oxidoreductase
MKGWQKVLIFFGRILISLFFILSAFDKILDWQETEHSLNNLLIDWQSYSSFSQPLQNCFSTLLDWIPLFLIFMVSIQIIGGLLLFLGIKVKLGAFLLLFFLFPATLLFHHFWFVSGSQKEIELILFLKNMAIGGGLLYVLAFGSEGSKGKSPSAKGGGGANTSSPSNQSSSKGNK